MWGREISHIWWGSRQNCVNDFPCICTKDCTKTLCVPTTAKLLTEHCKDRLCLLLRSMVEAVDSDYSYSRNRLLISTGPIDRGYRKAFRDPNKSAFYVHIATYNLLETRQSAAVRHHVTQSWLARQYKQCLPIWEWLLWLDIQWSENRKRKSWSYFWPIVYLCLWPWASLARRLNRTTDNQLLMVMTDPY